MENLSGLVHGYSLEFTSIQGRWGRSCIPHSVVHSSPGLVRRARENSFGSKVARMFNFLPGHIWSIDSEKVEVFKTALYQEFQINLQLMVLVEHLYLLNC